MSYFRTKQWGERATILGTTGAGTAPSMPNSGVSIVTATSGEAYVLQPPIAGVEKTIVFHQYSTTGLPSVRCSTASGVISILNSATGLSIITVVAGHSTLQPTVLTMKGINSTSWVVTNIFPTITTGAGGGVLAFSS